MRLTPVPPRLPILARSCVPAFFMVYVVDLLRQTQDHLTNGAGRPFGDDFINFWCGPFLAVHHRIGEVYDFVRFHAFEQSVAGAAIDFYHYSYSPVMLALSAPLASLPYPPALFVWLGASWFAFYRALRLAVPQEGALLLALSSPAVLINAVAGQNGMWTAALLGGGLMMLRQRPIAAGVLFGGLLIKPQLAVLLPVALLAGRHWRTLTATTATSLALLLGSLLIFGIEPWLHYMHNLGFLRHGILEDGRGVWFRFVSVFTAARRLGATVETAYAVQAGAALLAGTAVAVVWARATQADLRNTVLVLGTCLATPYIQDYDMVVCILAAAWLWRQPAALYPSETWLQVACGSLLAAPLVVAAAGKLTGLAWGPLFILPALWAALFAATRRSEVSGLRGVTAAN